MFNFYAVKKRSFEIVSSLPNNLALRLRYEDCHALLIPRRWEWRIHVRCRDGSHDPSSPSLYESPHLESQSPAVSRALIPDTETISAAIWDSLTSDKHNIPTRLNLSKCSLSHPWYNGSSLGLTCQGNCIEHFSIYTRLNTNRIHSLCWIHNIWFYLSRKLYRDFLILYPSKYQ